MRITVVVVSLALSVALAFSQGDNAFEVASIKENISGDGPSDPRVSPGRFSWVNATLRQLIQTAYDARPYQLVGLPDWVDTARFDVNATTTVTASRQQMNSMLQGLLADRFGLSVHRDRPELPVYALVLARRDGKLGPGLQPSTLDCESTTAKPMNSDGVQADLSRCAPQMGLRQLQFSGYGMAGLAEALKRIFDRPVVDKTGLSGRFDIKLSWTPDPTMLPTGVPAPPLPASAPPSIFTAVEEQLGLRLVSDRADVDVLVLDRINALKPN
jgi:uncharacterized protein (TIGR03435 family)